MIENQTEASCPIWTTVVAPGSLGSRHVAGGVAEYLHGTHPYGCPAAPQPTSPGD